MKTVKPVTETRNVTTTTCDLCGVGAKQQCILCKRDICNKHTHWSDSEYDDPLYGNSGDGPDSICTACWALGRAIRERAQALADDYDTAMRDLRVEWKEAAQAAKENEHG